MRSTFTDSLAAASAAALLLFAPVSAARAQSFLDLSSLTPGTSGSFTGTLNAIPVTVAIIAPTANFGFSAAGTAFADSTIDNTSPQYSYGSVYSPTTPRTDRIGYAFFASPASSATISVAFGAPITNPVFHVANLDGMQYTFTLANGLTGLTFLSGNGSGNEGLQILGNVISDANPNTIIGVDPATPPPTSGARSAYGSVQLTGTFQTLTFSVSNPTGNGDGGSFTFSTAATAAPEPSSLVLLLPLLGGMVIVQRNRCRRENGNRP